MNEDELAKLRNIIAALQDIHDAAKARKRFRDYIVTDLEEEAESVATLARTISQTSYVTS